MIDIGLSRQCPSTGSRMSVRVWLLFLILTICSICTIWNFEKVTNYTVSSSLLFFLFFICCFQVECLSMWRPKYLTDILTDWNICELVCDNVVLSMETAGHVPACKVYNICFDLALLNSILYKLNQFWITRNFFFCNVWDAILGVSWAYRDRYNMHLSLLIYHYLLEYQLYI